MLAQFDHVGLEDLPEKIRDYKAPRVTVESNDPAELLPMDEVERRYILKVLDAVSGPFPGDATQDIATPVGPAAPRGRPVAAARRSPEPRTDSMTRTARRSIQELAARFLRQKPATASPAETRPCSASTCGAQSTPSLLA